MDNVQFRLQNVISSARLKEVLREYALVAKPRLVAANLISAAGGYFLAAQGGLSPDLLLSVLAGVSCIVASGCVFNNYIDRHIDRVMARTSRRGLPTGAVSPGGSLVLAAGLGLIGTGLLWKGANHLALAIALAGFAVYVGAYSLYLKRTSVYSTAIGSLAGAAPPLAAYCAAANRVDLGALLVLAVFSSWQIAHSYAIAISRYDDYVAAALPVMPVKRGIATTKRHIVWHILAFALVAPMPGVAGYAGNAYLAGSLLLGSCWLGLALSGYRGGDDRRWARKLYRFSILIIFILSVLMAVDAGMPSG